jgi:hypothetical protein
MNGIEIPAGEHRVVRHHVRDHTGAPPQITAARFVVTRQRPAGIVVDLALGADITTGDPEDDQAVLLAELHPEQTADLTPGVYGYEWWVVIGGNPYRTDTGSLRLRPSAVRGVVGPPAAVIIDGGTPFTTSFDLEYDGGSP